MITRPGTLVTSGIATGEDPSPAAATNILLADDGAGLLADDGAWLQADDQ